MKLASKLFVVLLLSIGSALAGEDSTHRLHGTGPAFYEIAGGLSSFAAQD